MCREETISTAQQLLTARNHRKFKHNCLALGFVLSLVCSLLPHRETCDIFSAGDLDLSGALLVLSRWNSELCLCPSLSSVTMCQSEGLMGNRVSLFSPCAQDVGESLTSLPCPSLTLKGFCSRVRGPVASGSAASAGAGPHGRLICMA